MSYDFADTKPKKDFFIAQFSYALTELWLIMAKKKNHSNPTVKIKVYY
jgi:hypothetical protein